MFSARPLLRAVEPRSHCKVSVSFGAVTNAEVGLSAIVVGVGIMRIDPDRLGKVADGL